MLAEFLFPSFWRLDFPDAFHLLAVVDGLHGFVVEGVAAFGVFRGPDNCFGGVGEIAAGKIWRRIGLDPRNVVEKFEAELLHGETDRVNYVGGAADPDRAVWFQDALTGSEPCSIEFVIFFGALGFVPRAFVYADHASCMASDSAIGEEVGRVGEDYVNAFLGHGGKDLQAIALKNLDVVFGVFESGFERDETVSVARTGRTGFCAIGMRWRGGHRD